MEGRMRACLASLRSFVCLETVDSNEKGLPLKTRKGESNQSREQRFDQGPFEDVAPWHSKQRAAASPPVDKGSLHV